MYSLTQYPSGSIRELWTIAWPTILSCAAGCLMCLGDRIVVSFYSQAAFNGLVGASFWYWTLMYTFLNIILIVQAFVGRFNGAKNFKDIGPVVWQGLWISFGTWLLLIPFTLFIEPFLLSKNLKAEGLPWLQITSLFLPFCYAAYGALASFFSGRGLTRIVFYVSLATNLLNIILAMWFVFGWWFVPEMGIRGAAIATGIAQVVTFLIFFFLFYRKVHHERYQVFKKTIHWPLLRRCIQLGLPLGVGCFLNFVGLSCLLQILASYVSPALLTAYGISHSIYCMYFFFPDGLSQALEAICANAIGAKQYSTARKSLWSSTQVLLGFLLLIALTLFLSKDILIQLLSPVQCDPGVFDSTSRMLPWVYLLFFVEGFWFIFQGILTAAGDTQFLMRLNVISFWLIAFIPTCICIIFFRFGPSIVWKLFTVEQAVRIVFMYRRYRTNRWQKTEIKPGALER